MFILAFACDFSAVGQELIWEFETGNAVSSSPAIGADGTVYVGSTDRKVYALDGRTGAKRWDFKTGGWVTSSPAIGADGTVYVGSGDNKVYALDGKTGAKRWEFETGDVVYSSPAIGADGTVYVGSYDYYVYALDGKTGANRWEFETGDQVSSSPAIGADGTVYVGSHDYYVYALKSSSSGPADSPWPMFGQNAQRTSRAKPKLTSPTIQINQPNPTQITISFKDLSTGTYSLQSSVNLLSWQSIANDISQTDNVELTIESAEEKTFYRLKLNED